MLTFLLLFAAGIWAGMHLAPPPAGARAWPLVQQVLTEEMRHRQDDASAL